LDAGLQVHLLNLRIPGQQWSFNLFGELHGKSISQGDGISSLQSSGLYYPASRHINYSDRDYSALTILPEAISFITINDAPYAIVDFSQIDACNVTEKKSSSSVALRKKASTVGAPASFFIQVSRA